MKEWVADSDTLEVQTSGSTGIPKLLRVSKQRMMQSAKLTCEFLNLKSGDTALLCLPLSGIAGKMMLVRALLVHLRLTAIVPCGHPLSHVQTPFDFAAMIPLQVYNSLCCELETTRLSQIKNLIIGGAAIDSTLEAGLRQLSNRIYSTYGMTETLSHIALRRLNGDAFSYYYVPLLSVNVSTSDDGCLVIDAPLVCDEVLHTNDLVEIASDGNFRILGRADNVINSGGVKIQIEDVEEKLKAVLNIPFAITSCFDAKFGQAVVLLVEAMIDNGLIYKYLNPYECPKNIFVVAHIPTTRTGKIDRASCKTLAEQLASN